ncbi:MAG: glutamine--fructose-6-phosphate transaminase (isomerizing) [Candidatus Pelagibacterales bacterium]|jgi:glucosamine--fructose-6-phosphate aminotransferase (isomerizing)
MCGIIGIASNESVSAKIISGLKRLEYRGYDSAGISLQNESKIFERKTQGKLSNLIKSLDANIIDGLTGIGHTRWATHGVPSDRNAHPHSSSKVSLVHNGIIENASELKNELLKTGYKFLSDTDSEVITALITNFLNNGKPHLEAVKETIKLLKGSYALAIIFTDLVGTVIGAKNGSPLVAGTNGVSHFLGSDSLALTSLATKICYLEDGDLVIIRSDNIEVFDSKNNLTNRPFEDHHITDNEVSKGSYSHFMEKEIHEQPRAVGDTIRQFIDYDKQIIKIENLDIDLSNISKIYLIACGTAYYSCLLSKYYFEQHAKISVECDMASEFRYRNPLIDSKTLCIFVSQSGETADTLAALKYSKDKKATTLSIVNVVNSSIDRESSYSLFTKAGPEIGVASTKAFTAQVAALLSLAIHFGTENNSISNVQNKIFCKELLEAPKFIEEAIKRSYKLKELAPIMAAAKGVMYLGRGTSFPLALEGALKFKEISYIHAEGYPAGEMKHGPLALIEKDLPVVCIVPPGPLFHKTISNVQEVISRGGKILMITDEESLKAESDNIWNIFRLPNINTTIEGLIYSVPIQMLAYYTAVEKGNDVDQPRNLAKSVTVE